MRLSSLALKDANGLRDLSKSEDLLRELDDAPQQGPLARLRFFKPKKAPDLASNSGGEA